MSYGKHKVEHIINKTPHLSTDASGNTVLVGTRGQIDMQTIGAAGADGVFTSYGATAFNTSLGVSPLTTMVIGTTDLTHTVSNERPRFSTYTRKCVLGATGTSELRMVQMPAFDPDPLYNEFSLDIYIEQHPSEFLGTGLNPYITLQISNSATTSIGSNYSRWSFGANSLRQGWNTLKFRKDDTVSTTEGVGNLPYGVSHAADVGTGFNWATGQARALYLTFSNMQSFTVHVDQIRLPARAQAILVVGFDATGYSATDEVPVTKVAPLFASAGFGSYATYTSVYELRYAGGQAWERMANLQNNYGWDAINHTWNHGATEVGRDTTLTSLEAASDVVTATFPAAHGITVGKTFKAKISGGSIAAANGIWDMVATTTDAARYTATGAGTATATGTIKLNTFLSEVLAENTAENIRLTRHELSDITFSMNSTGFSRAANVAAFPNNAVPELSLLKDACSYAGIDIARGSRNGYTQVNEFGINEPLNVGSFELGSGASATTTSYIAGKITGAIDRGEHIWLYGHFILDDTDPAMSAYWPLTANGDEYPPANNGNPNPPSASLSSTGGWWYLSQLTRLVNDTIKPAIAAGTLRVMTPSQYAKYMGYTR